MRSITNSGLLTALSILILMIISLFAGLTIASHQACRSMDYDSGKFFGGQVICMYDPLEVPLSEIYEFYEGGE